MKAYDPRRATSNLGSVVVGDSPSFVIGKFKNKNIIIIRAKVYPLKCWLLPEKNEFQAFKSKFVMDFCPFRRRCLIFPAIGGNFSFNSSSDIKINCHQFYYSQSINRSIDVPLAFLWETFNTDILLKFLL